MNQVILFATLAVLASQLHAAPQFITFKDGKLGVNFGGYHAAVGIGGGQGLFAEAGTPHGQAASAGLGGIMGGNGNSGGLFAGATAGNGIQAQAGLGGSTNGQNSAGAGFASAQYGNRIAVAGLGGEASENGSSGVKFAGTNVAPPTVVVKETVAVPSKPSIENEIDGYENVLPLNANIDANVQSRFNVETPVIENVSPVKAVVDNSQVIYKEKPAHNVHKFAYVGNINRADAEVAGSEHVGNAGQVSVNKEIHFQRNPSFFADIFNIPIQALRSVSNLLGTAVDNTKISVQKTATVSHGSDIASRSSYEPISSSAGVSAGHQVTVESQQPGSDFVGNIFAIPINTLGAVNKFLENNVPARKTIQVSQSGDHELNASGSASVRLGPHARRRAAKRVIVVDTSKAIEEPQH